MNNHFLNTWREPWRLLVPHTSRSHGSMSVNYWHKNIGPGFPHFIWIFREVNRVPFYRTKVIPKFLRVKVFILSSSDVFVGVSSRDCYFANLISRLIASISSAIRPERERERERERARERERERLRD